MATAWAILVSLTAAVMAVGVAMGIVAASGHDSLGALKAFYDGAFGGRTQIAGTLSKMVPLTLVALGWIVAFRARRVNIGFEGQILIGGVAAALAGIALASLPSSIHLPLAIAASALAGAAWVGIAAWLWASRSVNEIISTLLLSFVAAQVVSWLLPKLAANDYALETNPVAASAQWPALLAHTALAWDIMLVPVFVLGVRLMLSRTVFGYQLRLTGANEEAARNAGVNTVRVSVVALLLSGALAGIAGSSLVLAGQTHTMALGFSAGYGFDGIVVALMARNSPLGCVLSALLFAIFRQSGPLLEARLAIPSELVLIVEGIVVILIAASAFLVDRQRYLPKNSGRSPVSPR